VGTLTYMAPEILKEWKSSYMSDIWSLGVVVFELLTGERPFTEL
jgi:serine/threonine protein kinase